MTREQRTRAYGRHLGCMTRGARGGPFTLIERYDRKRQIGVYRSVAALERGIERYGDRLLREMDREEAKR